MFRAIISWALLTAAGWAGDLVPDAAGLRLGVSSTSLDDLYWQVEPVVRWVVPWEADLGNIWRIGLFADATAGWLAARGDHAFIATLGPVVWLKREHWRVRLEVGSSPTLLAPHVMDQDDFGTEIQFTSHGGFVWEISARWELGCRWQHMSNAHLDSQNPGLNLIATTFFYRF